MTPETRTQAKVIKGIEHMPRFEGRRVNYYQYINSAEWREKANAAKKAAGYRCRVCNKHSREVTLDAHHRTYERLGHELPQDITVLCRDCHELYEVRRKGSIGAAPIGKSMQAQDFQKMEVDTKDSKADTSVVEKKTLTKLNTFSTEGEINKARKHWQQRYQEEITSPNEAKVLRKKSSVAVIKDSVKLLLPAIIAIAVVYFLNIGTNDASTTPEPIITVVTATSELPPEPSAWERCEAQGKYYEFTMDGICEHHWEIERADFEATRTAEELAYDLYQQLNLDATLEAQNLAYLEYVESQTPVPTASPLPNYEDYMSGCMATENPSPESTSTELAYCESGYDYLQRIKQDSERIAYMLECINDDGWDYCAYQYDTILDELVHKTQE